MIENPENRISYTASLLCKDCKVSLNTEVAQGACWLREEAENLVKKVKPDKKRAKRMNPIFAKDALSNLSKTASVKGCRFIQGIKLDILPRLSSDFRYLTTGHALISRTPPNRALKEK